VRWLEGCKVTERKRGNDLRRSPLGPAWVTRVRRDSPHRRCVRRRRLGERGRQLYVGELQRWGEKAVSSRVGDREETAMSRRHDRPWLSVSWSLELRNESFARRDRRSPTIRLSLSAPHAILHDTSASLVPPPHPKQNSPCCTPRCFTAYVSTALALSSLWWNWLAMLRWTKISPGLRPRTTDSGTRESAPVRLSGTVRRVVEEGEQREGERNRRTVSTTTRYPCSADTHTRSTTRTDSAPLRSY
jgi:hypothetical protein